MITQRQLFLRHLAQTSDSPLSLEITKAEGLYLFDASGRAYMDLISGISVSNLGHRHPEVIKAIKDQLDRYSYLMVYGEYILSPQVELAQLLCSHLPGSLGSVYFVNSGSEATEGAMKLAKRYTGRTEIIACRNAYHGSTQGALSVMGNEEFKRAFRPLLPGIRFMDFNNADGLNMISERTACVIIEAVQAEAGIIVPDPGYLEKLRKKCNETGALLILDEVQTGFGRTGSLFAFEQFNIVPDILTLAKGMGGGMPLGAFISSVEIMSSLRSDPVLGHITTYGGHPVSCAASLATLKIILQNGLIPLIAKKEALFRELLHHKSIKEFRSKGFMMALDFGEEGLNMKIIHKCLEKGVITDWFLFCSSSMRIAPPLTITDEEIRKSCGIILQSIEECTDDQ